MDPRRESFWQRQALKVAVCHNFAWWLAGFLTFATIASALFACALLVLRRTGEVSPAVWGIYAGLLLAGAVLAAWRLRGKWYSRRDGLVRLEARLGLNNRLTAAAAGIGEFPPERPATAGWAWRWPRVVLPLAGCVALLVAAATIPLSAPSTATATVELPPALAQVEAWTETLEEEQLVEERSLEELQQKLAALKDQPAEDWYGQQSLEAGDHLREQTGRSIEALQRDLQKAAVALAAMQQFGDGMPPGAVEPVNDALRDAIRGLELGNLPLNKEMLGQLKQLDAKNLRQLSAADMQKLAERLKKGASACKACSGVTIGEGGDLLALVEGTGAINRGPGSVPLGLDDARTELGSSAIEDLPGEDLSRALPGEVQGIAKGEHDVDPARFGAPVGAGAVASTGEGGDAVWRDSFTPDEREVLQRFFK